MALSSSSGMRSSVTPWLNGSFTPEDSASSGYKDTEHSCDVYKTTKCVGCVPMRLSLPLSVCRVHAARNLTEHSSSKQGAALRSASLQPEIIRVGEEIPGIRIVRRARHGAWPPALCSGGEALRSRTAPHPFRPRSKRPPLLSHPNMEAMKSAALRASYLNAQAMPMCVSWDFSSRHQLYDFSN